MENWTEYKNAPAPGTQLCNTTDIPSGQVKEFSFGDSPFNFRMFVYNDNGAFRAFRNSCPHFDVPLNHSPEELFTDDGQHFQCITHFARFDKHSGLCVYGPCEGEALQSIALHEENGMLSIAAFG